MLQKEFMVRVQSQQPLSIGDVTASNGDVMKVTPVTGRSGSYDVAVTAKKSGVVAVSTLAAASTLTVDVDTEPPQVRHFLKPAMPARLPLPTPPLRPLPGLPTPPLPPRFHQGLKAAQVSVCTALSTSCV